MNKLINNFAQIVDYLLYFFKHLKSSIYKKYSLINLKNGTQKLKNILKKNVD